MTPSEVNGTYECFAEPGCCSGCYLHDPPPTEMDGTDPVYEAWVAQEAQREARETLRAIQVPFPLDADPAWANGVEAASWMA